jgi:hypothetical protein
MTGQLLFGFCTPISPTSDEQGFDIDKLYLKPAIKPVVEFFVRLFFSFVAAE